MRLRTIPLLAIALAYVLAACQLGPSDTHPVPSVSQIGSDLKCPAGDHAFEDVQAGWGFCYPATWRYIEHAQPSTNPLGLDLTFDITDVPCVTPSAIPGQGSPVPICSPNAGLFGFMIVSTYERQGATSLSDWVRANLTPPNPAGSPSATPSATGAPSPTATPTPAPSPPTFEAISWGNSIEAGRFSDGRRIALTAHHVVLLDLRSASLDLEGLMSARLSSWKFFF
jgi:hypothetical protein